MFTELVRISCDFPACHGGSAKYQTCLIFHQPSLILDPDHGSSHLETVLSSHLETVSVSCCSHFQTYPILLPYCQETIARLTYSSTPAQNSNDCIGKKMACCKQQRPDLVASHQDTKSLDAESVISEQENQGHSRTRCKRKPTRRLQQQSSQQVC